MDPSNRRPLLATGIGIIASLLALTLTAEAAAVAGPIQGSDAVIQEDIDSSPAEVKASWSRSDFLNAQPADSPPPAGAPADLSASPGASISARAGDFVVADPTAYPQRLQGRVFFRVGETAFACSATVIRTRNGNAIFTAGHCVFNDQHKAFVSDFVFVPGYSNGTFPLGIYPATNLGTTRSWVKKGAFSGDIGIATLAGTPAYDLGGSRPVAFNLNPKKRKYTIYGYPGDPAPIFDGERLFGCNARFAGRDRGRPKTLAARPCHMGHGASGGGWISHGYLSAVSSYIYCPTNPRYCGNIYGAYFSRAAKRLFKSKAVGGSMDPRFIILKSPRSKVAKRKVHFRFAGIASTPLRYRCRLDRHRYRPCRARTTISHLRRGRHVLRVRAVDQTGRRSPDVPKASFRVVRR